MASFITDSASYVKYITYKLTIRHFAVAANLHISYMKWMQIYLTCLASKSLSLPLLNRHLQIIFTQVTRSFSTKLLSPQELHGFAKFHGPDPSLCRSRAEVRTSITAGNVDPRGTTFTQNYLQKSHFKRYEETAAPLPRL
jgi:hypothetical protein